MMPLGFPVVPEVYSRNSGCSASNASGVCSVDATSTVSCHHRSRPSVHGMSIPVRRTTRTCSTDCLPVDRLVDALLERHRLTAAVLAVGGDHQLGFGIFDASASAVAENPANTTEWMMPIRAHASIATIASGTIGM